MKTSKVWKIMQSQSGMTLLELILAIGIAVLLGGVVTMSIFQVWDVNARNTAHMTAVKEVENVLYWVTVDGQMAQSVPITSERTFPMTLNWVNDYDSPSTTGEVTYGLTDGRLVRVYTPSTGTPVSTILAENIQSDMTSWSYTGNSTDGWAFYFKITSHVTGARSYTETRVLEILPRSSTE
jgi:type II secretory pathway pseudopilin PulG